MTLLALIIAYFATGLLFDTLLIIFALFVKAFFPSQLQKMCNDTWQSFAEKYSNKLETEKYLGMKLTKDNWAKILFITLCVDMIFLWPKEIWQFCMRRR